MRVAIFFDGKNFYSGWRANAARRQIESFKILADWIVERANGSYFAGAYYYTGIETGLQEPDGAERQRRLAGFLDMLEAQTGFFVFRFPRKSRQNTCPSCGALVQFTTEKEVDTTLVADMLRLAAVNAFDIAVVVSGDADLAPAVEGVRGLGKQVYVATWGGSGLASRLRRAAFDHIDLLDGLDDFATGGPAPFAAQDVMENNEASEDVFVAELFLAQRRFEDGFVGVSFFLNRWRADRLEENPAARQRVLNRLVELGRVEVYDAPSGDRAMRVLAPTEQSERDVTPATPSAKVEPGISVPGGTHALSDGEVEGCLKALQDAEQHFREGFVGHNYFVTKWRSGHVTDDPTTRTVLVERLIAEGRAERYEMEGTPALRTPAP